ncbi:MAG: nuclear transport factor 2 family protein [Gammaproteobacteria bacterium]|nr:nuclear transport factor 2 family protein [Gammaproteobacteria bacterium]
MMADGNIFEVLFTGNTHHYTLRHMNLEQRIHRLEDRESIRTLIARYGLIVDQRDIGSVGMLFMRDGSFRSLDGKIASEERDAVLGPSNHFTHDVVIDLDESDPGLASGWVNSHAEVVRNGVALWTALRYHDRYRREDGIWRF